MIYVAVRTFQLLSLATIKDIESSNQQKEAVAPDAFSLPARIAVVILSSAAFQWFININIHKGICVFQCRVSTKKRLSQRDRFLNVGTYRTELEENNVKYIRRLVHQAATMQQYSVGIGLHQ